MFGIYFLAKVPTGDRLRLPKRNSHESYVPLFYLLEDREKGLRALRESDECWLTFTQNKNRVADQKLSLAIKIVQRGNRIIVIETFFAIPFSDKFKVAAT